MKKKWKKIWIASGCVVLFIIFAILILQSRFVKQKILSSFQLSLRQGQGIQFTVQSFDYNLLKLRFVFKGVQLQSLDQSSLPPVFRAEEINVNIPLSLILRRRLRIQDIEILDPEIQLHIDRDGNTNYLFQTMSKKSPQEQAKIPDILIEHFEARNSTINFSDKRNGLELGLSEIWIKGEGQDFGMHSFLMEMRHAGTLAYRNRSFPIEKCIVQAQLEERGMNIAKLFLASANNEFELSGRIADFSSLYFDGSLRGHFDVEDIRSLMAAGNPFSGKVEFQSHLKGPLRELEARISMKSEDLSYGKIENIGTDAELSWKKRALEILSFDLRKGKGTIHGHGTLHPLDWKEGSHLSLAWKDLDVDPFMDLIQIPHTLATETTGTLNVSWKEFSMQDVTGTCDVHLATKATREHLQKGIPLRGRIVAKADSGRFEITRMNISIPEAGLKGKLLLSSDELSGDLGLEVQSIEKMMPLFLAFAGDLPEKDVQRLGLDGPVSVSATLGGNLKKPRIRFSAESANFQVLKAKNLRLSGSVLYNLQTLQIQSLQVEDGEGRIEVTGIYPFQPAGQDIRIDIEGEALAVEKILEILGVYPKATGLIQFKARIDGNTETPRVQSRWSVADASLYGESFGRIEGEAQYRDGKIISGSLRVDESNGTLEASGFYDLENDDFKLRLSGKSFHLDKLKIAENVDTINAELDIDFEAHGNLKDPQLETKGRIRQLSIGARTLSDWGFEARSEQDEVLFKVEAPAFAGSIDGTVSLKSPYVLHAGLSISQMRFEDLKDSFPLFKKYDFIGSVTADALLSMDLGDPQKRLSFEAKIEQAQLKSEDRFIQNDGPILLSFGEETLRVERLLLIGTGTRIKAEGSLPLNIPSDSKISLSTELDLSLLNKFFPIEESMGTLKMESQLLGSFADLEIAAVLDFSDTRFQSPQFPLIVEDIQAHLEIGQNLLRVESFSGRIADASFGLKGEIPLASLPFQLPAQFHVFEEKKVNLVLSFEEWDPFSMMALAPIQISHPFSGTISGRIELEGQSLLPEDMSGKGLFETFQLEILGISFEQDDPTQIALERGKLSIENITLRGGENRVNVGGTASLTGEEDLNLSLDGELDLYLLSIFLQEGIFSGKSGFQIKITRSYRNPEIQGFLEIQDGRYQRMTPRLTLEKVSGKIHFKGDRVEIERITGVLNGGETILSGKIGLEGLAMQDANIFLKNEDSFFDFPKGLHSQVSGDLQFLSDGKVHQAAGTITILDAIYRDDFRVGTAVYNLLRRGSVQDNLREPHPLLNNLDLNVDIRIANNFIIDNNIAKAEAAADLKLTGTPNKPSLSGRASVVEGGEVYFNQNTFSIEQGTVDFINPTRIEPDLNLSAQTQIQEYEIGLVVQGTPDSLTASLVSDPPLSEPNIISLLVMGRTLDSASAGVLSVAGSTALSYLNNAITGRIEQATARALGLESVRIDAGLVSTEENPEARITLGQHLARDVELVFSQDLKDSRNQMWMLNYNPSKSFNIQGIKRDNNELNLALRHEIQFGLKAVPQGVPSDKREKKSLIMGDFRLEGQMSLPESLIFQSLKLKQGRKIDFINLQDALERIRRLYRKNDYLSYSLTAKREETQGKLDLILQIDSGPRIFLEYQGASIPKKIKKEIADTWVGSPFGQLALGDIQQRIRSHFLEKRYYKVEVRAEERLGKKGERTLVFQIQKGPRFGKPNIRIKGNRAVSEKVIKTHLEKSGVINSVFDKSKEWVKSIEDLYIQHGYLRPEVQHPVVNLDRNEKKASVEVSLDEGARYKVEGIEIKGLRFFKEDYILSEIGIRSGDIVSPERFNQIDRKIHELYVQNGFNHSRVETSIQVNSDKSTADLNIDIQENQRGIITELSIKGNEYTSEKTIQRELMFHKGEVLNFRMINDTRKRLYDLGIFERVNIDMTPIEQNDKKYFRADIDVEEFKPYRLRYGIQYDTETSFGVLASLVNRNFLGNADLLGTSLRLNRDERDARAFFRSPYFFSKKINTELFMFYNRTIKSAFTLDRIGFTLQQQIKIKKSSMISYNYSFEKIDTLYPVFEGLQNMDSTDRLGTLNVAFTRDTRDDILDATRGMFLAQSLRYAPGFLGSKTKFIRYFGQYNTYQKLSDFLTYAASIRVGLGKGLSRDLPTSERFYAGGGTTIRGFKKDELGPRDTSSDLPLGGNGVFILNQEFRFPIFKKLRGVVFLDLGNVYPKISDIDFFDVRKTAGFGFRLHTPFVLIRFDWGFKLDRRPGETLSLIFFSIGQAF